MSVKVSSWVWHEAADTISGNDLIVLLALSDIANDAGRVTYVDAEDATQVALAKKSRVSRRTFQRIIERLTSIGVLVVEPGRQHAPASYQVLMNGPIQMRQNDASGDVQMRQIGVSDASDSDASGRVTPLKGRINVSSSKKRPSRIPDSFVVDDSMRVWAREHAPAIEPVGETANFVDHWTAAAGASAVKVDWVAAWRTWMRNAQKWAVERGWKPDVREVARAEGDAVRDAWLAERGVTLEEYSERWDEPGWVASLESRLVGAR